MLIDKSPSLSPQDCFRDLHDGTRYPEAVRLRDERYAQRHSTIDPSAYTDWVGSLDATSCLGVTFWDERGTVITAHVDGRNTGNLYPLFERCNLPDQKLVMEITGGELCVQDPQKPHYTWDKLDESTQENWLSVLDFVGRLKCDVELRCWTLGFSFDRAALASDYLAHPDGSLVTFAPGTLYRSCEIPESSTRFSHVSMVRRPGYHSVSVCGRPEQVPLAARPGQLDGPAHRRFAEGIVRLSDDNQALLEAYSTTPELEQDHFLTLLKAYAGLVLDPPADYAPAMRAVPPKDPLIVMQGEAICYQAEQTDQNPSAHGGD